MFQKPVNSITLLRAESKRRMGADSYSTDNSVSRHLQANCTVIQHPYGACNPCAQMSTSNCTASPSKP